MKFNRIAIIPKIIFGISSFAVNFCLKFVEFYSIEWLTSMKMHFKVILVILALFNLKVNFLRNFQVCHKTNLFDFRKLMEKCSLQLGAIVVNWLPPFVNYCDYKFFFKFKACGKANVPGRIVNGVQTGKIFSIYKFRNVICTWTL